MKLLTVFIIIKDEQWVGFYNMDSVVSVIIKNKKKKSGKEE